MTRTEIVQNKIEELENNDLVVGYVLFDNGIWRELSLVEDLENVIALGILTIEEYEENGYDLEGLIAVWVEL